MLGIFKIDQEIPTLYEIKSFLKEGEIQRAEKELLTYLTHPHTYDLLSKAFGSCVGIIRFITSISFSPDLATANCDVIRGNVQIGVDFFLNYIQTNADLLTILLHERNHYLIRKLNFINLPDLNAEEYNILEDAYINGPLYKMLRSPLLESYYKDEIGIRSVLSCDSNHLANVLSESKYSATKSNIIYNLHLSLYKGKKKRIMESSYEEWMREGRDLAIFFREEDTQNSTEEGEGEGEGEGGGSTSSTGSEQNKKNKPISYEDPQNDPTIEDIQRAEDLTNNLLVTSENGSTRVGAHVIVSHDFKNKPESWATIQKLRMNLPYDIHAIIVPEIDLDSQIGKIISDSWDASLEYLLGHRKEVFHNLNHKLNKLSEMIGSILSQPSMQDTGLIGKSSYPYQIHRRDLTMLGAGHIPTSWDLYFASDEEKIPLYVDVSYSMETWYVFIPWIIQHLKTYIGKLYHFSTYCLERNIDTRILLTAGGTYFDEVAKSILENHYKIAIILTDNGGVISKNLYEDLQESGVKIYLLSTHTGYSPLASTTQNSGSWRGLATKETIISDPPQKKD